MTDILEWLEKQTRPMEMLPECRALMLQIPEINDAVLDALFAFADAERREGFARGFRLSAQLFSSAREARYSS